MEVYKLQNQSFPIRIKFNNDVQCLTYEAAVELAVSLLTVSGNENRLDPYPNGKSKDELFALIQAKDKELAKSRILLRKFHDGVLMADAYLRGKHDQKTCPVCTFLAETSTVKS